MSDVLTCSAACPKVLLILYLLLYFLLKSPTLVIWRFPFGHPRCFLPFSSFFSNFLLCLILSNLPAQCFVMTNVNQALERRSTRYLKRRRPSQFTSSASQTLVCRRGEGSAFFFWKPFMTELIFSLLRIHEQCQYQSLSWFLLCLGTFYFFKLSRTFARSFICPCCLNVTYRKFYFLKGLLWC